MYAHKFQTSIPEVIYSFGRMGCGGPACEVVTPEDGGAFRPSSSSQAVFMGGELDSTILPHGQRETRLARAFDTFQHMQTHSHTHTKGKPGVKQAAQV